MAQWAEIRWWKHYLTPKSPDQYFDQKKQYWLRTLNQLNITINANDSLLDAGCGPAGVFMIFEDRPIDALDPLIQSYKEQFPSLFEQYSPQINFIHQPLEAFQATEHYDYVFCFNAINHVREIDRGMEVLLNCLKPGGRFCIAVDAHRFKFIKNIFQWMPFDFLHPHQLTLSEFHQLINKHGGVIHASEKLKPGKIFDYYAILGVKAG